MREIRTSGSTMGEVAYAPSLTLLVFSAISAAEQRVFADPGKIPASQGASQS